MNLKKTGVAIAMAAMMMSGAALAGGGGHGHGGPSGGNDYLSDNTLEIGAGNDNNNNGAGNDNNQYTSNNGDDNNDNNNNGAGNDHNRYTSNDGNDNNKWKNSNNTNDGNDDNTWRNSNNQIDASHNLSFEVDMVLAKSDLAGHISNTSVEYGESAGSGYRPHRGGSHGGGCNTCEGAGVQVNNSNRMTGFNNAAGITTVGQSAGANSMVQQSVVTNATVQTN